MEEVREVKMFCGTCPDSHCGNSLYFIPNISSDIDCTNCGQRHPTSSLLNVTQTDGTSDALALQNILKSMLFNHSPTKKGSELVKVRGLSNYHCKLVSPLLTLYGMDKHDGKAKLLSDLGQRDIFDCSVLANRAFLIEEDQLDIDGYGKDKTGSLNYLGATLELINNGSDLSTLVPLHVDGDGHCLVHAISRSVVGRELLWHSLRQNLRDHLEQENTKYQGLFHDFIDNDEWVDIIAEADPNFYPATNEPFGLRNIHVFGLANVLHRPIILLDSIEGLQSSGDYSGIFLPALLPPEKCKTNDVMNKPLAIAWSSSARNHYVPLVGIKGRPLPKLHRTMLPKAWGIPNQLVPNYVEFDENDCCIIGGLRALPESYVNRLVLAMDSVFFEKHQVYPELVTDVNQFICKPTSALPKTLAQVIEFTQEAVLSETLYRCLSCQAVKEVKEEIPKSFRKPGGTLYKIVEETKDGLIAGVVYSFQEYPPCYYSVQEDILKPLNSQKPLCDLCNGVVREVRADGTVKYENGDNTLTPIDSIKGCQCGYKHYWDGQEYDNPPKSISVLLEWNGTKIEETIAWFDKESNPALNSNAFEIATGVVQKHFPGEFGSEVLVRKVVDKILRETAVKQPEEEAHLQLAKKYREHHKPSVPGAGHDDGSGGDSNDTTPTKIILTGSKKKTLHKEELTMSETEKLTKARIAHHAAYSQNSQKRKNISPTVEKAKGNSKQGKQDTLKAKETLKHATSEPITGKATDNSVASTSKNNPNERKIRLSSSDGRQATVTLTSSATYRDLQDSVFMEFRIAKHRQRFRYGYPPVELTASEDENSALPLRHGDRVRVEQLPEEVKEEKQSTEIKEDLPLSESMETAPETTPDLDKWPEQGDNFKQLASDLRNFFKAFNGDHWETMQHQPELFTSGGYIYENVVRELGPLSDDQHCSITELPGKTFAYNAKEDRLEICLGRKHVPVQPLDAATLAQGKAGSTSLSTASSHDDGLGVFSGALRHRDVSEGRCAFSGTGRTLGGSVVGQNEKKDESKESFAEKPLSDDVPNMDVALKENMTSCQDNTGNPNAEAGFDKTQSMEDVKNNQTCEGMLVDEPLQNAGMSTDDGQINVLHEPVCADHANTDDEMGNTYENDRQRNVNVTNEERRLVHGQKNDPHEGLGSLGNVRSNVHGEGNVMDEDTSVMDQEMSDAQKTSNTEEGMDVVLGETTNVLGETKKVHEETKNVLKRLSCSSEGNINTEHAASVHELSLPGNNDDDQSICGAITEPTDTNARGCISPSVGDTNAANEFNYLGQSKDSGGQGEITTCSETPKNEEIEKGTGQPEKGTVGDRCDDDKPLRIPGDTTVDNETIHEVEVLNDGGKGIGHSVVNKNDPRVPSDP